MTRCWIKRFSQLAGLTLAGLWLLAGATACSVVSPSCPATPQVSGRVLAADSGQPLAGVKVWRVVPGQSPYSETPAYGAQLLQQSRPILTDADGYYLYPSSRYFTIFRRANRWSLKLDFQAAHYAAFQTNFTTSQMGDHVTTGTPIVHAGDVLLAPLTK